MGAAPTIPTIDIRDCTRGISDRHPARIDVDQVEAAYNVEFWQADVCVRRRGTADAAYSSGNFPVAGLGIHTPTTNRTDDRMVAAFEGTAVGGVVTLYDAAYTPVGLTLNPNDNFDMTKGVDFASHGGKLFIAAKSDVDRLHVFDPVAGSAIRRTGYAQPPPPTVATQGSGTFGTARQYRVRYVTLGAAAKVLLRSEPSTAVAFTPPGNGLAARITHGAVSATEYPAITHWEVEELGQNGVDWYRIATVPIATTFYDDTLAITAVATTGILSDDIGDYQVQWSAKWLAIDEDRLILAGSHMSDALSSRVAWTPLGTDTGAGNDERIPADVNGFLDFDTLDGGAITGIKAFDGKVIVFKNSQVHQMVRSSSRLRAYVADTLSRRHGAIRFTIVEGTDVDGLPCLYFLDPEVGPMQLGIRGLRVLAPQLQSTWKTMSNAGTATQMGNGVYHPEKRQVWWHIATGSSAYPDFRWMYSVESDGVVFHTVPTPVRCGVAFRGRPHLGLNSPASPGGGIAIVRADDPVSNVDWLNTKYRGYIRTRAYQMGGLMRRFQIDSAVLESEKHDDAQIVITLIRDYFAESRSLVVRPVGTTLYLTIPVDNAYLAEGLALQVEIGDPAPYPPVAPSSPWKVHGLTLAYSLGSPSTGRG